MSIYSTLVSRYQVSEDPLLSERRVELLALLLTLVFFLILLFSVASLIISSHPVPKLPSADSLVGSELRRLGVVSPQHSIAVRARPVFWPSRRPVVDAPVEVVKADKPKVKKSELDKVKLLGIFGVGESTGIIALVQGKKKRILQGGKVVGWTLDSIDGDQAVFVESGQVQNLTLERLAVVARDPVALGSSDTGKKPEKKGSLKFGGNSPVNEKKK